ncbi:MAG: T9SS type A sorting domain-containing protein [Bacteroidales bacterium]
MKAIITFCLAFISVSLFSQSMGDTLVVPTFNYGSLTRDTMIDFPDDPNQAYEKIFMLYNMRCKDGLISVPGNTNRGCGEWDYSCNTYITDSTRVDSILSYTNAYYISAFSGSTYNYVDFPLYNYYQYREKIVELNHTNSETMKMLGTGNLSLSHVLATSNKSGKSQYLYSATELTTAGIVSGHIDGLLLNVQNTSAEAGYLKVQMKNSDKTVLDNNSPDNDGFTEVYFRDYAFSPGSNRIQFHTPFMWDGTSGVIVEFSFTNNITSNPLQIIGGNSGFVSGLYTTNGFSLNAVNGKIDLPAEAFSAISNEITVSFWSRGNQKVLPNNNSIFYGIDNNNNREINVHLPWSNASIYFDCGNNGSGSYDRIDKAATSAEFEGVWSHWTFTKNTVTGSMKIYHNGELWHSGTGKTLPMDIQQFVLASIGSPDLSYFGNISEFQVWNKELDQSTIQNWMYRAIDNTHPDFANLVAYYKLDEGNGTTVTDASVNAESALIQDFLYWVNERGSNLSRGFIATTERPNLSLAQGSYDLTITDQIIMDSVVLTPNIVRQYEIIPRYGTMLHDSIHELSVNEFWESQYVRTYDPEEIVIDSVLIAPEASIEIGQLSYYSRYPSKYELMSFVTPYGIYLDMGMEGKTWFFDVSDYAPILKGRKRISVEGGGQWQEDMDIRFMYITGTPPHDVLDINQIWRPQSSDYASILSDRTFEPRSFPFRSDGAQFKIRSEITGHGQEGEFIKRHHTLNIDEGDIEFDWLLWKECSTIPIYPQGGTWIYDRTGWCPGTPTDIYEFDITPYVNPGQTHTLDYSLVTSGGSSNYLVSNQLVSYGPPHFAVDASLRKILKPNAADANEERFNPACSSPEVVIQNTGSTTLTSLHLTYSIEGGPVQTFDWTGSLAFLEQDTVVLPIPALTFWLGTADKFTVNISNPNNQTDEYLYNNTLSSVFDDIEVYPYGELTTIQLQTNNVGNQTRYTLYTGDGNVFFERGNCGNNTLYNDTFILPEGCYKLRIDDTGGNGLEFWNQPNQGTGYFNILDGNNVFLYAFDPDFGGFAEFEFGIGNITGVQKEVSPLFLSVFPNPATDKINIQFRSSAKETVSVMLLNALSGKLFEQNYIVEETDFITSINLEPYPAGIYFVQIQCGKVSKTEKIIKY